MFIGVQKSAGDSDAMIRCISISFVLRDGICVLDLVQGFSGLPCQCGGMKRRPQSKWLPA